MKKFTETLTWQKPWFAGLTASEALAWKLLNDMADHAGVVEIPDSLLQLFSRNKRLTLALLAAKFGADRLRRLPCGKYWLPGYIEFQHGKLSRAKKPHQPVFRSIEKHQLPVDDSGRVIEGRTSVEPSLNVGRSAVEVRMTSSSANNQISLSPDSEASNFLANRKLTDSYKDRDKDKDKDKENSRVHTRTREAEPEKPNGHQIQPTTDELRVDPWEVFTRQTGMTRDQLAAYIAKLPEAQAFKPTSVADGYIFALSGRNMRVWDSRGNGRLVDPMNLPNDLAGFIAFASQNPQRHKLEKRVANGKPVLTEHQRAFFVENGLDPDKPESEYDACERSVASEYHRIHVLGIQ